ncbi:MAG: peptide chain release factor N(5)-glutamine methyltransferase [Myxococcota bacterium]
MSEERWTILKVLDTSRELFEKRGVEGARLDAEVLIAHALKQQRVMLYARHDQPLLPEELDRIRALVKRRANGEPVAYILGNREFYSLELEVSPAVLIPRPDTETLVEVALARLGKDAAAPKILDVGTGSGAVALALAKERPDAEVSATDVSAAALAVATKNAARLGLAVRFTEGDLLASLPGPFQLIAANLPYIPSADLRGLMREVRDHEPALALDGGPDGLRLIARLIAEAPTVLAPAGAIALEAGFDQLDAVAALLGAAGFDDVKIHKDYGGQPRVASGIWRGSV